MSEQTTVNPPVQEGDEDEISLLDLAIALGEEKKTIARIAGGFVGVAVVVSLLITPTFTAKTVMMPPQQQQSGAASALASLGALAGMAGGVAGLKSPDEMYVFFLNSESLQNAVIEKLSLRERYDKETLMETRKVLDQKVNVLSDKKSGLITIEADDKDPEFAAKLANAHVEELKNLMGRLAVTDAQQRRVFYEQQIAKTQEDLAIAEAQFLTAKAQSGLQVTAVIAETGVRASAEMHAQIAAKEVQLEAMGRFATGQNPDVQRVAGELSALRSQLAKLEKGSGGKEASSPMQQQAMKAYRSIKAGEAMMGVLIAQYESARVDEAKEGPLIQQVDVATAPEKKSKPKRALMVLLAGFAGLFVGVLYAFATRAMRRAADNEEDKARIDRLKAVWRWRN